MKNLLSNSSHRSLGRIFVAVGVLMFTTGILLRNFYPGTIADSRIFEGFGILLFGWGIIPVIRSILSRFDPPAAHRAMLEETDERATGLRNQAGYFAFIYAVVSIVFVLIVYSALTRSQAGFDLVWCTLIFLSITPVVVFSGVLMWLNRNS